MALATIVGLVIYIFGPPDIPVPSAEGASGGDSIAAKMLSEAQTYDDESYVWGGGHPPQNFKRGRGLDCSGLVDVVVMEVTGIKKNLVANQFMNDENWKAVKFEDARPGDIVYRLIATHGGETDHVGFVVANNGPNDLKTFEAYGTNGGKVPQKDQVGHKNRTYKEFTGALRFHK